VSKLSAALDLGLIWQGQADTMSEEANQPPPARRPTRPRTGARRPRDGDGRRGLRAGALVAACALALLLLAWTAARGGQGGDGHAAGDPALAIRLTGGGAPVSVPRGFVGFSIEYTSIARYLGGDPAAPNPAFLTLVRNLNPGQSPSLRIGGDTTDWTWWPVPGMTRPGGIRFTLTPSWATVVRAGARALDARLILGINFEADSRRVAATEARQLIARIGRRYIAALELGNEPEVYGAFAWYRSSSGTRVYGRPHGYDFSSYLPDYARIAAALPHGVPVAGPASGAPVWWENLGPFLADNPSTRLATFHRYPLRTCYVSPRAPDYPTIANLLSPYASEGLADSLRAALIAARADRVPLRVDELNSVSCAGKLGVSNTFASALWATDALFAMARAGVAGVNVHTFVNAKYEPFGFSHVGGHWRALVKPLYYGLALFTRAAPPGAALLRVQGARPGTLRLWATRSRSGVIRLVAINDSSLKAQTIALPASFARARASLERLTAPSLRAQSGVRLAGQRFGPQGTPVGALATSIVRIVRGRYLIRVPAASAALLTITP
jgi:hypothetical protein